VNEDCRTCGTQFGQGVPHQCIPALVKRHGQCVDQVGSKEVNDKLTIVIERLGMREVKHG